MWSYQSNKTVFNRKVFYTTSFVFFLFFFFLSLKFLFKKCIEIPYTLHPVFPNVSILCNHSIGSKPGNGLLCDSQSLFRFLQFSLHSFVCVNSSVQFYDLCRFMQLPLRSSYKTSLSPQGSLMLLIITAHLCFQFLKLLKIKKN